jgi:hypothetical protein
MTQFVAFRLLVLFAFFTALFVAVDIGSPVPLAEAILLISGSLCVVMAFFALTVPVHTAVPVRVRRRG